MKAFIDADFAGGFNKSVAKDPASVCSRTGFVIKHASCPIIWKSKLQTEIALLTTEAEYVALSIALREVIPITHLLRELGATMDAPECSKSIKCVMFEDNNSTLELANANKMGPRTKHITIKCYHFRARVQKGDM